MSLLITAALRAAAVLVVIAMYSLNPETATFNDLFQLLLRGIHSKNAQNALAMLTVLFFGAEMVFSIGSYVGASPSSVVVLGGGPVEHLRNWLQQKRESAQKQPH
ncbi:hypothetical protein F6X40_23930 [Paraburkholderia sp. UCT31]|uniref:hypothetical protein n=1 Tax=Paraburkholderia sp. UCT31 TaxID=2615209 RepID=UPI0016560B23|nr:hypothetical protein [Paraburkholderia sp. UCT31]MBC8739766.1 hypothetical protein [Paraburkholderia sp. UCT31]